MKLFILIHEYDYNTDKYEEFEQKYLGVYSSKEKAQQAAERYYKLPGFNKYPFNCFYIEEQEIDVDYSWTEGFVSWGEKYFGDIQDVWS